MNVEAKWASDEIREVMFEQMARTFQQLTATAENCYIVPGHNVQCNIGDFIYLNYPDTNGHPNYVRIKLFGPWVHDTFKCCRSLNKVDEASDSLKDKSSHAFGRDYSRDNKCLIWLEKTCGECGGKCDTCGNKCPDDCPKGNC
ncbi:hypothetical protein IQ06DRAFT_135629 [Phaeosphaeriaceae sp. SRC1lsM3a]|nr:hypothetical protein IQ06DRAFT_135629 [Stagonospora sp. SRC1lsM3a]